MPDIQDEAKDVLSRAGFGTAQVNHVIRSLYGAGIIFQKPAKAENLATMREKINELPVTRERQLALTKLDEMEMWLERCIT